MLIQLNETLTLAAAPPEVWRLLRDTRRLASLLPGVESIEPLAVPEGGEAYAAKVTEKVGPFRLTLKLEIRVTGLEEPSRMKAELKGSDGGGSNRMTGSLEAILGPGEAGGTRLQFGAAVEVLGKLASLGAVPIRRRSAELFAEFAGRIERQFASPQEAPR